jgi:[acyl-carrier-protein] S-malonyltransferase
MLSTVPELEAMDRLIDAAEALSGLELRTISTLGGAEDLADTRIAQPLLYLVDWAWGTTLLECGLAPVALAGHSLGEFAALALAGVFSVEAGLELVVERSKLMATTAAGTPGGMSAVLGMDAPAIASAIEGIEGVWIANDNAPGQVVISGTSAGIAEASAALTESGARRIIALQVAGAFHSPLMAPAAEAFAELLSQTEFGNARIPVLQNTDPTPSTDAEAIRSRLLTQITSPVRWTETMLSLAEEGPVTLIECGPGSVLSGLAKRVQNVDALSVQNVEIEAILQEVS